MESKIVTHGINNQLVINTIQTRHFQDLYLHFFHDKIEEEKNKDTEVDFINAFNGMYCNWALEEILKLGLVTIYHFWERCLRQLFKEQSNFLNISLTVSHNRKSFVQYSKETLEIDFSCIMDEEIWKPIDEARKIVNCYKHGDHESFNLIKSEYPHYFEKYDLKEDSDLSECFILGKENFKRLTDSIVNFWEKIPHTPRF